MATILQQLESAEAYAAALRAQIMRLGGTPPPDSYARAVNFKTQPPTACAATPSAPAATAAPEPVSLRKQLDALPPGKAKEIFKRDNWQGLLAEQEAAALLKNQKGMK